MKKIIQLIQPKTIFLIVLSIQLLVMVLMSLDVGISADEKRHYLQAEKVFNYYASKGENKQALENTGRDPMQFNGQSFDNLMFVFEKIFKVDNYMEMRHFFNAITGWIILLITGLIAKRFWGYKGAVIAVILLFLSPRFLGHAINNNKDIPFALGFMLSFYGILRFLEEIPRPKKITLAILTLGIAGAISIRMAGILTIAFFGLFSLVYYIIRKPVLRPFNKEKRILFTRLLIFVPAISIIGFFLGIAFWPFMTTDPVNHFKEILEATSSHPLSLAQLFDGDIYLSNKMPKNYIITYILYTYPLVVIFGIVLYISLLAFSFKKNEFSLHFMLIISFAFVVIWMSLKTTNIYGGIRHILFIYPVAITIAVFGFRFLTEKLNHINRPGVKYIPYGLLMILLLNPVIHNVKNYPYSYVYFNQLIGGFKNAYDKYESDYFQHSLKHATEWLVENELNNNSHNDSIIRIISNDDFNTRYYLRSVNDSIQLEYSRYYNKHRKKWDYAVFYCSYINPVQLREKLWPPKGTIHTEDVDGMPIAAVVKRTSYKDLMGFEALGKNNTIKAKEHFTSFLKEYPESEEVLEGYARACLIERKADSTLIFADSALSYNPRLIGALLLKASAFNFKKEFSKALPVCEEMIAVNQAFAEGHYQKGIALRFLNRPNEALKAFQTAMSLKENYYDAHMQTANILINHKKYNDALNKIYKKVLGFKKGDVGAILGAAKCYHFLKQNNNAEELLEEIPGNYQTNFDFVKLKSRIELDKNNIAQAARLINMARNINTNSELSVIRALYMLKTNRSDLAKNHLDKARELDNTNREASDLLAFLNKNQDSVSPSDNNAQKSIMYQNQDSKNKKIINPLLKK